MNREQRRNLLAGKKFLRRAKKSVKNWTCPHCTQFYPLIYVQSTDEPYLYCYGGCENFYDLKGNNVNHLAFPDGKPF